jgi:3-hydroxyisobutyrate dehydrogenase/glyoxylate/succinic semialdehyde reductase
MHLGFIGTGIMGSRMAANLQKHGCQLVVHNRTREKAEALLHNGATWAATPAAVAEQVDVLFTMLAHPAAVQETALGPDGFLDHLSPDALWVDCTTANPSFSRSMAEAARQRQIRFVEAPGGGTKQPAEAGTLVFIVGGDTEDVETCRPWFEMMGSRIVHAGPHGMATSLKLVLNHLLATSMAAFAEGLTLGQALGLPKEMLLNILLGTPVVAPFVSEKRYKLEQDDYEADFPLRWMQKDLQMTAVAAYEAGVSMPLSNVAKEVYQLAVRHGLGEEDFSAIYSFLHETSGLD